eukprot:Skav218131  [mRNA]  locus=scaffold759:332556:338535:- [translate_table: standard]
MERLSFAAAEEAEEFELWPEWTLGPDTSVGKSGDLMTNKCHRCKAVVVFSPPPALFTDLIDFTVALYWSMDIEEMVCAGRDDCHSKLGTPQLALGEAADGPENEDPSGLARLGKAANVLLRALRNVFGEVAVWADGARHIFFAIQERAWAVHGVTVVLCAITASMTRLRSLQGNELSEAFLLRRFLKENHISPDLQSRVVRYIDMAVNKRKIDKSRVQSLNMLSGPLRVELQKAYSCSADAA